MILSYHPLFSADENRSCAGRQPDRSDQEMISRATAVILPQGCPPALYRMARSHCPRVFPNYDARFDYPEKTGQIRLFKQIGISHPRTESFTDTRAYAAGVSWGSLPAGLAFPIVFKYAWGGEGKTVYRIENNDMLADRLNEAAVFEKSGQGGFLLQQYIPTAGQVLRVVRIGEQVKSYWRIAPTPDRFPVSLTADTRIDPDAHPARQQAAMAVETRICNRTGINLAGFDFIFSASEKTPRPLVLEINYFFGRTGLGGSEAFYALLIDQIQHQIRKWTAPS